MIHSKSLSILFVLGRDLNNDRWNQDNQGNSNFNNFRNNNRNMNHKGNMNNMNNSNSGNMSNMNSSNSSNSQPFGFPNNKPKTVLNGGVIHGYASAREIRSKHPNANDCEIVVLEKHLV